MHVSGRHKEFAARFVRVAHALKAVSLWAYIPYRCLVRPPRPDGLGDVFAQGHRGFRWLLGSYGGLAAMTVAWRPEAAASLLVGASPEGHPARSARERRTTAEEAPS